MGGKMRIVRYVVLFIACAAIGLQRSECTADDWPPSILAGRSKSNTSVGVHPASTLQREPDGGVEQVGFSQQCSMCDKAFDGYYDVNGNFRRLPLMADLAVSRGIELPLAVRRRGGIPVGSIRM